jgi:hypothetical protein
VTVPDGTTFLPGESFSKVWRLKNIGSCSWTTGYALVFMSGDRMGGDTFVPLSQTVLPGQTVDLAIEMVAPTDPGDHRGYWGLRTDSGVFFGVGAGARGYIWTDVRVKAAALETVYDFASRYCDADWHSGAGGLPCRPTGDDLDGFATYLMNPALENRREDEPTLWVHPNESANGWISGTFPAFKVRKGDRFRAWVGCLEGYKSCDVLFQLDYRIEGEGVRNLGRWHEVYEGKVTSIDLDLTGLHGEQVEFILRVDVRNDRPGQAHAFWFVPRIDRIAD